MLRSIYSVKWTANYIISRAYFPIAKKNGHKTRSLSLQSHLIQYFYSCSQSDLFCKTAAAVITGWIDRHHLILNIDLNQDKDKYQ